MGVRVVNIDLHVLNMHTRMPFKYGIATLTALPHLMLRLELEIDGAVRRGVAADGLPPKWFTKDPDTHFRDDLSDMLAVIRHACDAARSVEEADTVFDLWQQVYTVQSRWGAGEGFPPLLSGLGAGFVERAAMDAFCRAKQTPFAQLLRDGALGLRLGDLHDELRDASPGDLLPAAPLRSVIARHTVGLADPLTDGDIAPAERADDGLPQSLEACIAAYGLTHFKIKLCGDAQRDIARLRQLAAIITRRRDDHFAFTLDGNEQYRQVEPFRQVWRTLAAEPAIAPFLQHVIFIEQPLHRDAALSDEVGADLRRWPDRPPIIIDESDGDVPAAARALELGYAGTSFKNCKGVFKGVANACLLAHRRRADPAGRYLMSGEDLANVGPIALQQDLAVAATLGLGHVERNGHHYFRGLSMWPPDVQRASLAAHGDVYATHRDGFPTLRITGGAVGIATIIDAPFGLAPEIDVTKFTPLDEWRYDSLET